MNIEDARLQFKFKTGMTPTVRMNIPSDSNFAQRLWTGPGCADNTPYPTQVEGRGKTCLKQVIKQRTDSDN